MKMAYPIIISKDEQWYVVSIPDLQANTQGETLPEAMEMARDAIGMTCCYLQDENRALPLPTNMSDLKESGDIITLVDIDLDAYRRKHETKTVRKNLTIPSWLNEAAEQAGLNFSAVLQEALKAKINAV